MVSFYDTRIGRYVRKWKYGRIFNQLAPGEIAIDCGANVGKITARLAKPGVTVYAFEPDPNAWRVLQSNFKDNPSIVLINKAVSDHKGRARIYFSKRHGEDPTKYSTGTTLLADKPNIDTKNFAEVEVIDLAEFIAGLDKPIGIMKMDIEGEEVVVLNKLIDRKLTDRIRHILVETHERFPTLKEPTKNLKKKLKVLGIRNIDLDWA